MAIKKKDLANLPQRLRLELRDVILNHMIDYGQMISSGDYSGKTLEEIKSWKAAAKQLSDALCD